MMNRFWNFKSNPKLPLFEQLVQSRDIDVNVLSPSLDSLPDEALLANIGVVTNRLKQALYKNEPIVIFGHDDPDGITSTYILYRFLESCGYQKHYYYIPNRNLENHGIQQSFLDFVKKGQYPLIITVDNGSSALEGVKALQKMNCDVIVCDHHLIQKESVPQIPTIINPQLPGCLYPYKMLAGVGVVLMLIRYMSQDLEHQLDTSFYFWTAVGSIADKVPMTGVNWIIVRYVLENWDNINDPTFLFLLRNHPRISNISDRMNFIQYCCKLIANGRDNGGQHIALRFMLQLSHEKARLFQLLEEEKNEWESSLNDIFKLIDSFLVDYNGNAYLYYDEEDLIPYSLLGTAATYVVNKLGIPALFLKKRNGIIICEGRCNKDFNMMEAFNYCKDLLIQYGGHVKAAGFSMNVDNYDKFAERFHEYILTTQTVNGSDHYLNIDALIEFNDVQNSLWCTIEKFIPFGQGNPEPIIVLSKCTAQQISDIFIVDNNSIQILPDDLLDIAIQVKSPNLIHIVDYRLHEEKNCITFRSLM